ncbi:hypothetical protein GGS21DRAFT_488287 [Xylaria nigripes]|nr:hypothetical protein GGS21DRAFT_488287 [Xylaria nigripes]
MAPSYLAHLALRLYKRHQARNRAARLAKTVDLTRGAAKPQKLAKFESRSAGKLDRAKAKQLGRRRRLAAPSRTARIPTHVNQREMSTRRKNGDTGDAVGNPILINDLDEQGSPICPSDLSPGSRVQEPIVVSESEDEMGSVPIKFERSPNFSRASSCTLSVDSLQSTSGMESDKEFEAAMDRIVKRYKERQKGKARAINQD